MTAGRDDLFMLELFRSELAANAAALLRELPEPPGGIAPESQASLLKSVHAIKSAAHIVGAPEAAGLAEAMETSLQAAARAPGAASAEMAERLRRAAQALAGLGELAPEVLAGDAAYAGLAALRASLAGAQDEADAPDEADEGASETSAAGPAAPEHPATPAASVVLESPATPADASPAGTPAAADAANAAVPAPQAPERARNIQTAPDALEPVADEDGLAPGEDDLPMLELFRQELASAAEALSAGLPSFGRGDQNADAALVRAVGTVSGAALIVSQAGAAALADAAVSVLSAGSGDCGDSDGLDALFAVCAVFQRLAAREPAALPRALRAEEAGMADLAAALKKLGEDGAAFARDKAAAPPVSASASPGVAAKPGAPGSSASTGSTGSTGVASTSPESSAAPAATAAPGGQPDDGQADLADLSMLDLFRMELETNAGALEAGLVELEDDQRPERVEPLMRAAHSVKGAARIVGLSDAVNLAHAMEDLLEACRKGALSLSAGHIDVLLAGNDVFEELAALAPQEIPAGLTALRPRLAELESVLAGCLANPSAPVPNLSHGRKARFLDGEESGQASDSRESAPSETPPAAPVLSAQFVAPAPQVRAAATGQAAPPPPSPPSPPAAGQDKGPDAVVRVTAENLNRLMGLAGECLVEARGLESIGAMLARLKTAQSGQSAKLALLRDAAAAGGEAFETAGSLAVNRACAGHLAEVLGALSRSQELLSQTMERFDAFSRRLETLADRLYNEVIDSRMRPFSDGLRGFPRMIRDLAKDLDKRIRFVVEGEDVKVDREILERLEAPLTHLLRNAADHGLELPEERAHAGKPETGSLILSARHFAGMLLITVRDDGHGLDPERIRKKVVEKGLAAPEMAADLGEAELLDFLFLPGFSTAGKVTEISGRGVGLDVVHSMVRDVGGQVRAESVPGQGMTFFLRLPLTLSVVRTLMVRVAGEAYAVPLTRIDRVLCLSRDEVRRLEGKEYCVFDGDNIGLAPAWRILGADGPGSSAASDEDQLRIIVISDRLNRFGMVVEAYLGERDLVVKPLDPRLGKIPCVSAASVMEDGSPILILDVDDMVRAVDNLLSRGRLDMMGETAVRKDKKTRRILVVDDSLTVREMQRRLLSGRGYETQTAVDGMDGLNALRSGDFDLVITDVDMPRLDGVELTRRIRADARLTSLPVMIVSYKDREEDRMRGLEAGADYYLTKSSFQDEGLLTAVADLIGEAKA